MNPRLTAVLLVVVVPLLTAPLPLTAACEDGSAHAYFSLSTGSYGFCAVEFGVPITTVQVLLNSVPATKARFTLPDPPFGTIVQETWNYPATGNRLTGIELNLGACAPGATDGITVLGTLQIFLAQPVVPCTPWQVNNGCEVEVCDGAVRPAVAKVQMVTSPGQFCGCCFQCCEGLPAYALSPANGATGVPPNVTLSWAGGARVSPGDESAFRCAVRISTDPACGSGQEFQIPCGEHTFAPSGLEPATTYYWQVSWTELFGSGCSSGASGTTAIHSFKTGDPLAVEPTTWGRVKAIYRD